MSGAAVMEETVPSVWIGCFACYNNGNLLGAWYPASEAGAVTTKALHAKNGMTVNDEGYPAGKDAVFGPHEELWCFDIEGFPSGYNNEMSPQEAQLLADAIEALDGELYGDDDVEAYFAWVKMQHGSVPASALPDYVDDFRDHFHGVHDTFRDYADQYADEMLGVTHGPPASPWDREAQAREAHVQWLTNYFDYESHAREMEQEHTTIDLHSGNVAVFSE